MADEPQTTPGDFDRPTMRLRLRVPPTTTTQPPVLEQAWEHLDGSLFWVSVPIEVAA